MGWWRETIDIVKENDPAARTTLEVLLTYPGVKALAAHRLSHFLWKHGFKLLARMHSQFWRFWTQIEIHPGAQIDSGVFIDHGSGLVIGETAIVEKGVLLYHGVTLGGTGKDVGKRHPTVRKGALISAHAQVIGPVEIGENAKVGAAAVVVADVPSDVTVVGIPAKIVRLHGKKDEPVIHEVEEKREYYVNNLSNMLNFDPNMPAFFLYYEKGELVGLLTVYADDQDVEVTILVHPAHRRQGIARALLTSFERETASFPIRSVTFQTERVFLDSYPDFVSNWGLVEDEETETWLGKDRKPYPLATVSNLEVLLADRSYQDQISQLKFQAFSEEHESREVVDRYVAEALKDPESRLYILLKNDQVIGTCTVDLSSDTNYFYGLAISEPERGKGYGSYLAKSLVNQLIEQNDKEFQIAVEDSNVGAKRLYEKIGFVKQTQVVYLNDKGARDSEV